jgi:hypothetical protein
LFEHGVLRISQIAENRKPLDVCEGFLISTELELCKADTQRRGQKLVSVSPDVSIDSLGLNLGFDLEFSGAHSDKRGNIMLITAQQALFVPAISLTLNVEITAATRATL